MTDKKVATVIGVGPGLGAALARRFAADYAVALVARNAEKLVELAREISAAGGTSLVVPADVSKEQEIVGVFERIRRERRRGVILFTGATAGVKPFPTSAAFGPAKFAMRGLAHVMARNLGPEGIHVAWINVDGMIDMPAIHERFPQLKEEDMLKPSAIADTYWHLAHQDPSAWTLDIDVRPFKEKF